jgi:cell division protein FtsI (penicillin-binding protein 3)
LAPTDGADIVTTIDVNMQDLAERSLVDELKLINGDVGVAIVMEVATGDIKAIANMSKADDGEYYESQNHAVSDLLEPGSVFKTASIMVALDDGVVDTTYHVDTGSGSAEMHGAKMRDHNWHRGGYGTISLPRTLEVSSNIGVSKIIDRFYGDHPEKFVDGIYRLGLPTDLHIPLVGAAPPRIRHPKKNERGQYLNWSKTALPWMSIGYETQVPPISTLTFYNAIANNGRMMRPRFVKQVVKDGKVLMDFPPVVIKERICKEKTLKEIQTILYHVVSQGLGKKAGSPSFKVAGKTGTAQVSKGAGGYKSG